MSIERRLRANGDNSLRRETPSLRWGDTPYSVAPFVPTPIKVVRTMLKLAEVGSKDVVYDLGCGDGRILFTAIEEFDACKAVGYDLNSSICEPLQIKLESKGLGDRIQVMNSNFFNADISQASVITLYLTTSGNSKLRPKLEQELKAGARIVSHDFPVHNWITSKQDPPEHYTVGSHKIYVYRIPEAFERNKKILRNPKVEGNWKRIRNIFQREYPR